MGHYPTRCTVRLRGALGRQAPPSPPPLFFHPSRPPRQHRAHVGDGRLCSATASALLGTCSPCRACGPAIRCPAGTQPAAATAADAVADWRRAAGGSRRRVAAAGRNVLPAPRGRAVGVTHHQGGRLQTATLLLRHVRLPRLPHSRRLAAAPQLPRWHDAWRHGGRRALSGGGGLAPALLPPPAGMHVGPHTMQPPLPLSNECAERDHGGSPKLPLRPRHSRVCLLHILGALCVARRQPGRGRVRGEQRRAPRMAAVLKRRTQHRVGRCARRRRGERTNSQGPVPNARAGPYQRRHSSGQGLPCGAVAGWSSEAPTPTPPPLTMKPCTAFTSRALWLCPGYLPRLSRRRDCGTSATTQAMCWYAQAHRRLPRAPEPPTRSLPDRHPQQAGTLLGTATAWVATELLWREDRPKRS